MELNRDDFGAGNLTADDLSVAAVLLLGFYLLVVIRYDLLELGVGELEVLHGFLECLDAAVSVLCFLGQVGVAFFAPEGSVFAHCKMVLVVLL